MEGLTVTAIIEKGHWRAEIDTSDLDSVEMRITMYPLDTCEALMADDGEELQKEYAALRYAINDYVNGLYELRNGGLAYAV